MIYLDGNPLCKTTSENAHMFFAVDEDGMGMERGELTRKIINKLKNRDDNHQERWDKVWDDALCQKYKRKEHADHWLWNHAFYSASIEDLEYILRLVSF